MTFREKLQREHPEKCNDCAIGGCDNCPSTYGYEPPKGKDGGDFCGEFYNAYDEDALCTKCWDREIPEGLVKIKTLQESALKALEYDEPMKNGEWVTRGGGLEFREKDGRIEFRYVGPTVSNEEPAAADPVNAPSHYNAGGYECWEVMEAVFGKEAVYHFALCNAFKYLWRAGKKDDLLQDLRKAAKNLEKAIEVKEKQENETD